MAFAIQPILRLNDEEIGRIFDTEGRLVGIVSPPARDGQSGAIAAPAEWIRDLRARGEAAIASFKSRNATATAATTNTPASAMTATPVSPNRPKELPQAGDTWTYAAVDLMFKPGDRSRKYVHTVRAVQPGVITEKSWARRMVRRSKAPSVLGGHDGDRMVCACSQAHGEDDHRVAWRARSVRAGVLSTSLALGSSARVVTTR